jgi:Acetamidase/Formamidase family
VIATAPSSAVATGDDLGTQSVTEEVAMAAHEVRVDYAKTLAEEPETGHNRWHPDIPPVVTCDPGDEVILQTRDAFDGQMGPAATLETDCAWLRWQISRCAGRAAVSWR